jgi:protein SCO1/2
MKLRIIAVLLALAFCRSLLAGDSASPSRASTLPQESPAAKPDACCAADSAKKTDACCAAADSEIQNRESKIQNFSAASLYQLEATFTDDTGKAFSLGSLRGRPVAIDMFFASCGYACPLTVADMLAIQGRLPAEARDEAVFVLVSFDIAHDTPAVLARYRAERGLNGKWILLHGDDAAVRELAALLGVKFKQEADGAFSHSNLVTILNREGEIVHQRIGLKGGLDEAAAALTAAAQAK